MILKPVEVNPDGIIFDADRQGDLIRKWKSLSQVKTEKGKDYPEGKVRGDEPKRFRVYQCPCRHKQREVRFANETNV